MISTIVWGTGNVGRAAIRAVHAHPELELTGVLVHDPAKVGRDAGRLAGLDHDLGVAASADVDALLARHPRAVVYAVSGDIRPDDALRDIVAAIRAGAVVVTPPSTRSTIPQRSRRGARAGAGGDRGGRWFAVRLGYRSRVGQRCCRCW